MVRRTPRKQPDAAATVEKAEEEKEKPAAGEVSAEKEVSLAKEEETVIADETEDNTMENPLFEGDEPEAEAAENEAEVVEKEGGVVEKEGGAVEEIQEVEEAMDVAEQEDDEITEMKITSVETVEPDSEKKVDGSKEVEEVEDPEKLQPEKMKVSELKAALKVRFVCLQLSGCL